MLDQIVTNLVVPNNIQLSLPVHCRIMLTDTIETTTVGNTILVSKGLIDTMPQGTSLPRFCDLARAGAHRTRPPHRYALRFQRPVDVP